MHLSSMIVVTLAFLNVACDAQTSNHTSAKAVKLPTETQWTLEASSVIQQSEIKSVVLLICPLTSMKGTGFFIKDGYVVTNNHVLMGCSADQMIGKTSFGTTVHFSKAVSDQEVDLAILKPVEAFSDGLDLAAIDGPAVGTAVSTWGYPLSFNGPAPLLSNGYVAGFTEDGAGTHKVKHLVIDGAINPGNSGGPLFRTGTDKVIGIIVAKYLPYSDSVQSTIKVLADSKYGLQYSGTGPNGQTVTLTEAQVVAQVLQEFYNGTQVEIGEAISVSELRALLVQRGGELK